MRTVVLSCVLLCTSTASGLGVVRAPYVPDSGDLAVRCGRLIDGLAVAAQSDRLVIIRDGRIESVKAGNTRVPDIAVLDLSDHTCLPGLIDTHTHLTDRASETRDLRIYYTRTIDEERRISRANAEITLFSGFTTARNVGAYSGWSGRDLRDRINAGEVAGPRVLTAGYYLTIPAGGGDLVIPGVDPEEIPFHVRMGVARGADQFRECAEALVAGGADFMKIIASGAVLAYGGVPGEPEMTPEEISAVVEVAHGAGLLVTAHAHGAQSIKEAIRAGADSIEHASLADDEAIALAAEHQVAFSMDVYNGDYIATAGREQGWPEEFLRKNDETVHEQREVLRKAYKAGVPIIYGTDSAVYPHGDNALQFPIMVEFGMTPMDAIRSATSVAAHYIGWDDRVGAIDPGRFGDLIAVRGDPLTDVSVLQEIGVVIKGGQLFRYTQPHGIAGE